MIACSAARSTSVTKSLGDLDCTVSRSSWVEARLMTVAARRAALTAMFRVACMM
jgi:hypothetical protein